MFGFMALIALGTALLCLPVSSAAGEWTSPLDALFTAVSASCVTGLVVLDTATYWSAFGQAVILAMIQVGGLGVITVAMVVLIFSKRKITLTQRSTLSEAISAPRIGGIVRLVGFVCKVTLAVELAGALLCMPSFCWDFGLRGVWISLFHSVSAFCNAGFDIIPDSGVPFDSLMAYRGDVLVNLVTIALILVGGIGFLTWDDIREHGARLKRYSLQSKVVLAATPVLILVPAVVLFFSEYQGLPLSEALLASLFQAVTPRTAGYNTTDLAAFGWVGRMTIIVLMLVGGSPGSTAGGMKITTLVVLFANSYSVFNRKDHAELFGRTIPDDVVRRASTIQTMYIVLCLLGGMTLHITEGFGLGECLFETASAIGTVGLSLGLTASLGTVSRVVLVLLMFCGRIGGLTLIYATLAGSRRTPSRLPQESLMVG